MPTFKIISSLLTLFFLDTLTAQTIVSDASMFIGKTQKEIVEYNTANKNELFKKQSDSIVASLIYEDSLNSMTHHFYFARQSPACEMKCFTYLVNMSNKSQYEKVKADILAKCQEILTEKSAVQVSATDKYLWRYSGSDLTSLYTVSCEKKERDGNSR